MFKAWWCFLMIWLLAFAVSLPAAELYTNAACYSAGTQSIQQIEAWLQQNLNPEGYDIWCGRKDRLYLNGAWKMVKLNTTNTLDATGEKAGFWKSDFNDQGWFNQPAPWSADIGFPEGYTQTYGNPARVDWYRRHFAVPAAFKGKRLILHFEAAHEDAAVWLNGVKLGEHRDLPRDAGYFPGMRNESFAFDITDRAATSGDNVLVVRCAFRTVALPNIFAQMSRPVILRGLCEQVFIEARPAIYLEKALITPRVGESLIEVRAFVVNTQAKTERLSLRAQVDPWHSARHPAPGTGAVTKASVGPFILKPGTNELNFAVKLDQPQTWSPEHPFLYHFKLFMSEGWFSADTLIGQERFGFREITAGGHAFYLNGRKLFLRGEQETSSIAERTPYDKQHLLKLNFGRALEKAFDLYLAGNRNLLRLHSTQWSRCFYDIADEKGLLIYEDEKLPNVSLERIDPLWFDGTNLTAFFAGKVKQRIYTTYNNPALILSSEGNELYDTWMVWGKTWAWAPYIRALRAEWKKHDTSRPLACSSGRTPSLASLKEFVSVLPGMSTVYVDTDFHDMHNYWPGSIPAVMELEDSMRLPGGFQRCYRAYQSDHPGTNKVMLNGETLLTGYFWMARHEYNYQHNPLVTNGLVNRRALVEKGLAPMPGDGIQGVGPWGIWNSMAVERIMAKHAETYSAVIELHRRQREWVAGWVANTPASFINGSNEPPWTIPNPFTYTVTQKDCQPVHVCFDSLHDRHLVGGNEWQGRLYIMNDREELLKNLALDVAVFNAATNLVVFTWKKEELGAGDMEVVPFRAKIPDLPTGHYQAGLRLAGDYQGRPLESRNEYPLYVLGRDRRITRIATPLKVGLYHGHSRNASERETLEQGYTLYAGLLTRLGVPFKERNNLEQLEGLDLIFIPPYALTPFLVKKLRLTEAGANLDAWVQNGGRLVYAEQQNVRERKGLETLTARHFSEIIVTNHPLFAGLERDDFRFWNGSNAADKAVCQHALVPLNDGLLATAFLWDKEIGMTITEQRFGRGLILRSQLLTAAQYGRDAVATRYLENLLNYTLGGWTGALAGVLTNKAASAADADENVYQLNPANVVCIDLRSQANMGLRDDVAGDKKGGWCDQGPGNDMRDLPVGKEDFLGVPFDIIDPNQNQGKSVVVLRGRDETGTAFLPDEVKGIAVPVDVKRLFLLVTSAWTPPNKLLGELTIEYDWAGVAPTSTILLESGKNIGDWWGPADLPDARVAWRSGNASSPVGLYLIEWRKPVGNAQKMKFIHFKSKRDAVLFLVAVTGEKN